MKHFPNLKYAFSAVVIGAKRELTHEEMAVRQAGVNITDVTGVAFQQVSNERVIGG